jgi:uncharacterized protein (DUF2249 family)
MTSTLPPEPQTTLTGEHALLFGAATSRANAVLTDADQDRWPTDALAQFLDYLHLEVLRQVVDEEWLLFRNSRNDPQQLSELRAEHQELRRLIDDLGEAAAGADVSPRRLAQTTRELVAKLQSHIVAEEQALGSESVDPPSMSALGSTPHGWYALIAGDVIDLDAVPGPQGTDAALGRMLRLRAGERLELRASSDPYPIWRRLAQADPGGYGFTYLQTGPPQWRVQLERRPSS